MNVLSLFDGISCLQLALNRAGIHYDEYYASEVDKHAIAVTQHNFPRTIQLGDVRHMDLSLLPPIDLICAGSPCQDGSALNKEKLGLKGVNSSLFYYFVKAKEYFPKADYVLENVAGKMATEITSILKVRPIKMCSSWIVPQTRNRLYWTNIPINTLPKKNRILLSDILQPEVEEKYYQSAAWNKWWSENKEYQLTKAFSTLNPIKANCLTKRMYASWNGNFIEDKRGIRRLTPIECERLQTIPDNYTAIISDNKRYEAIGNGWTVDIISWILKHMK